MSPIALTVLALAPSVSTGLHAPDATPHGRYVEARTATVFAGACHYGSEESTAGREALLAWRFEGGRHLGIDLAGLEVVATVACDGNLAGSAPRRSRLYFPVTTNEGQRAALRSLLVARVGRALGTIDAVHVVPLEVRIDATDYNVESKDLFLLSGSTLPDRDCCKMPYSVWYTPMAPVQAPIVGNNARFRNEDARLGRLWSRPDENASFTGRFQLAPTHAAGR